ncbi:MAG: hypothetical protein WC647_19710 [Desulfomonilaceae bacterium]
MEIMEAVAGSTSGFGSELILDVNLRNVIGSPVTYRTKQVHGSNWVKQYNI